MAADLWWVPTGAANAYLWRDPDGVVVLDPGLPGEEDVVLDALARLGGRPQDIARIVLTHWHSDHSGAAAALATLTGAEVLAGAADAAVLRGESRGTPPDLTEDERPVHEAIARAAGTVMDAPRIAAARDLHDRDRLGPGGGAVARLVGGHTEGSVAVWMAARRAVLTGDLARGTDDGGVAFGLFHVDRARTAAALRELAAPDPVVAGFGHGPPATGSAASALRVASDGVAEGDGLGEER
ncbi:hypothetical protein XF36_13775 [Pseudonocardia sp. HH130629-09]|nr:hypothetical protein XF36_13775 [Pseudonocardia sp. HH130629-09]